MWTPTKASVSQLLREVQYATSSYEVHPLICPDCGSEMPIVAFIPDAAVIRRLLEHLHLWDLPPPSPPAPLLGSKRDERPPHRVADHEPERETRFAADSVFPHDVPAYPD